jgi:hypothetical protein
VTSCPPFPPAKFGHFVTWVLDPFVMSCWLFSEMLMFCHRIFWHTCDGYGQSYRTEIHQPMDQCAAYPNLT